MLEQWFTAYIHWNGIWSAMVITLLAQKNRKSNVYQSHFSLPECAFRRTINDPIVRVLQVQGRDVSQRESDMYSD